MKLGTLKSKSFMVGFVIMAWGGFQLYSGDGNGWASLVTGMAFITGRDAAQKIIDELKAINEIDIDRVED